MSTVSSARDVEAEAKAHIANDHDGSTKANSVNEKVNTSALPHQNLQGDEKLKETNTPPSPPNGGVAWIQVAGAFFLFFNSWGVVNTFGVYQAYYETNILSHRSSSDISWIGTFQGFLLFLVGVLSGPIFDRGYFRALIIAGSFLVTFGMMMTSISTQYYEVFLSQGLIVGVGAGCLFVPSVAIVATYFTTKRALATGCTAAGGSIGGVIFPIIFRKLQPTIGFGWATRVIAFIVFGTLLFSIAVMKPRLPPPKTARSLLELPAFKEPAFTLFSLGLFLAFVGLYFPFFYAPIFGSVKLSENDNFSFYLLPILNAASAFGRIIPGLLADRFGSLNLIVPCCIIAAILAFAWIAILNTPGLIVFCVLYGFFSGAIVSLPPTIIALLSPDMSRVGTRMGMSFTFAGLGLLIGNPIAGAILNLPEKKFSGAQAFAAATLIVGAGLFVVVRVLVYRSKKVWKA